MKKLFALGIALTLFAVPSLIAAPITLSTVGGYGPYQTGQGGEFTFYTTSLPLTYYVNGITKNAYGNNQPNFQTFCVEGAEHIEANATYTAALNTKTVATGVTLTQGAAWLYCEFARGVLAGYDYTGGTRSNGAGSSADLLQKALWAFMGSQEGYNFVNQASNPFVLAAKAFFGTIAWADTAVTASGASNYGVLVLNLFDRSGANKQDMLIYVPDGGTTVILLGLGMLALGLVYRRVVVA